MKLRPRIWAIKTLTPNFCLPSFQWSSCIESKVKNVNNVEAIRDKDQVFQERLKILFPVFFFLLWQSEVNCITNIFNHQRNTRRQSSKCLFIKQTLLHSVGWAFSWCNYSSSFPSPDEQQISPAFPNWCSLRPNLYYLLPPVICRKINVTYVNCTFMWMGRK